MHPDAQSCTERPTPWGGQASVGARGVDAETLHQAALDALSIDDFDSARVYLRQAVQLAPQACNLLA